jgi:hypothetical protein
MTAFAIGSPAMVEGNSDIQRSRQNLVFTSGRSGFATAAAIGMIVVIGIFTFTTEGSSISLPARGGFVFALLVLTSIGLAVASREWIAQLNMTARRLKISRRTLGRWTKTVVECPLDECNAFGTIEYNTDGHTSYGVYVELKQGARHAIPLKESNFKEAARVAEQLSTATGIPRLDTRF